jgi:ApaG protein
MSVAVTLGVRVEAVPAYVAERSSPEDGEYFFAYTIRVTNQSDAPVQLMSRHWIITDGAGRIEEVRGAGVVGEQPVIRPGETFQYTSGCPLSTPFGSMEGTYQMVRPDGSIFDAQIPAFELAAPVDQRTRYLN